MARFVIGIDLGTSNSTVAYADLSEVEQAGRPVLHELAIPQLTGPGDIQERLLLPSALYEPSKFEWIDGQDELPWTSAEEPSGKKRVIVGEGARRAGAKTPVRYVDSAKSWLCHGGVNRTASILPWHAPEEIPKLSPVDVSAFFLAHVKDAWDHQMAKEDPSAAFSAQEIVLTVPASFDEVARQLTLEAARRAKIPNVTLIEEPLAAFYAFIARTGGTPETTGLHGGERILIADVGGGTTDFTLIEVAPPHEDTVLLGFERTAVGDHLLLGGDNIDLALAHAVEPGLTAGKRKLDAEGWAQLKLECRLAKEALFTDLSRRGAPIVLMGRGSKLIGASMKGELDRDTLDRVVLDGFFPELPPGEQALPKKGGRVGFAEYGLPYASEPAITRHLAAFLMRHRAESEPLAKVDAILFNGGALKPVNIRDRISRILGDWMRSSGHASAEDPRPLIYDQGDEQLELAVARGAAYFGLVRSGRGLRVGGGSPREYFLQLGTEDGEEALGESQLRLLCVAPKGMQDGHQLEVSDREFQLVTNRPVSFPMFTSTGPEKHSVGDVLVRDLEGLVQLPPLQTVVKFGKQKPGTTVPVRLQAKRTEIGTLELSCFSRMSGARFSLEFDLRGQEQASDEAKSPTGTATASGSGAPPAHGEISEDAIDAAKRAISETYAEGSSADPAGLMKRIEEAIGLSRGDFPLIALRALAEHLLELIDQRAQSPQHEERWLNLVGFCLRPGSGFPLDDWRVRQLWKIHGSGLVHDTHTPGQLNWWILWRRVASGLTRGHQEELSSNLFPLLVPSLHKRAKTKPPRSKSQDAVEMWRCAASLENLGSKNRALLGGALMDLIVDRKGPPKTALWCLGRIGARKLLYGPKEATVKPTTVSAWIDRLLAMDRLSKDEEELPMFISLARLTGDRQFDLDEGTREKVRAHLETRKATTEQLRSLSEVVKLDVATERASFGESLPVGLRLG